MKKILLILTVAATALMTSCVNNKEMIYLQGADSIYANSIAIDKNFQLLIQSDDQLAISITSRDAALINQFNNSILVGSGGGSSPSGGSYTSQAMTQSGVCYFYVYQDGYIEFPIVGKVKAAGLTVDQLSENIRQQLSKDVNDVQVTAKIMSFKITVLGDVKTPGTQSYTGQRLTLLEALGRAGDLNASAIRTNVLVIREENGKRTSYKVDLTKPESVFNSPAYYMQQNDLVYVESNKSVKVKGSTSYTYLTVTGTLVSMVASIVSLIIALTR
ncbi:MAG: polysaccharide export protein [Bacteroidaceae bacterium]|nr:polysaccharide export protein [Bacteroidaceae bacterium]